MERAKNKMPRLGGGQSKTDCLKVTHLAHQNNVGILAQSRAQRFRETQRVAVDFSLIHQAPLALMDKLDRILNREDMVVPVVVNEIDHRREGRRFTRASWSGDQNQTSGQHGDIPEHLSHAKLIHRQHLRRNRSEYRSCTAIVIKGVNPKARHIGHFEGKIRLEKLFEVLALPVIHDVVDQRLHLSVILSRHVDASNVAIDPNHGRQACGEVEVGSALLDAESE